MMLMAQACALLGFACYAVVLTTLQEEWHFSNLQSGFIASAFFGYILTVPLATALTDRVDARKVYLIGGLTATGGLLSMGLLAYNFWTALFFMALNGAGLAGTYMPRLKILSDRIQSGELTRHIAFYMAFFGIGTGFSYLCSGWILSAFGWHYVFGLIALSPFSAFLIVLIFIPALEHEKWKGPINFRLHEIFPIDKWKLVLQDKNASDFIFGYTAHSLELFASRGWIVALAIGHAVFIMADSASLTAGLVISAQDNIKGAAMGLHSLMEFGGGLLDPAIFGCVLDVTGSRASQVAWIWAYVAVVMWGIFFVIYERRRGWGSSARL